MNGVDLNLFEFERDLTWMAFFMDGNDRIYTRYGGREDSGAESHLNRESLIRVMRQVLDWHKDGSVDGTVSRAPAGPYRTPEQIPTMAAMIAPRKEKCIHCHDVKGAVLRQAQATGEFRRDSVFTYPPPSAVGLLLSPSIQNRVESVRANSPAEKAGIRSGDLVASLNGRRVFTFADFQSALDPFSRDAAIPIKLLRGDETVDTTLALSGNWRRSEDPSWRESLHLAGPGAGFWGEKLKEDARRKLGLGSQDLAIRVTAVFGAHAREAGIKDGDIVTSIDGIRRDITIHQLQGHLHLDRAYGDVVPVTIRRADGEHEIMLKLPKGPVWGN